MILNLLVANEFLCEKNEKKNEIQRYKARLVARGFSQRPGVDCEKTYSPVMDAITLHYLICFTVHEQLEMNLMDVVTTYLYGSLDNEIKDLRCLNHVIQYLEKCIQFNCKDHYMV